MASNISIPLLLAADNSPQLIPLLRTNPSLASEQDEHGYSLMHAAASYNHLDLLRTLVTEFGVDVNILDEDGETALFVAETIECGRVLVEELHADTKITGEEGKTAREKIEAEGDFPALASYLRSMESSDEATNTTLVNGDNSTNSNILNPAPPLPEGVSVEVGTMAPEDVGGDVVDPEFRRRIEELATRGDFQGEEGQRELRELITEAVTGQLSGEREVRQRTS
jgi:hypothetical protein